MHLDMRASKGYTQELEKLNRDHREFTLKIDFKTPITKKKRFWVYEYSKCKYLYHLTERGLTMKYKSYDIAKKKNIGL